MRSEWQQAPAAEASTASGSRASSSSSSRANPPPEGDRWQKAAETLAENPDMLKQASDVMSKMSPEQLEQMMNSAPLPPGIDAATMKSQMEQLQKNPDMLKSAMDSLNSIPEEERKKMLAQRSALAGAGGGGGGAGYDPSSMNKVFENPAMLQQAVNMTKDMSEDDLKKLNIHSKEQADMMRQAAEQMAADPNLTKQMSEMMKNMSPKQMEEIMSLSGSMKGAGGGMPGMPGMPGGMPSAAGMDPTAMMNDPDMVKAAEQMMQNLSPETLASMARASGVDMSEDKAKMVAKYLPYLMKLMRAFSYVKKGWSAVWSKNGRIVLAVVVLLVAVLQHYRSS